MGALNFLAHKCKLTQDPDLLSSFLICKQDWSDPNNISTITSPHNGPVIVFYITDDNKTIFGVKFDDYVFYNETYDLIDSLICVFNLHYLLNIKYQTKSLEILFKCFEYLLLKSSGNPTSQVVAIVNDFFLNEE